MRMSKLSIVIPIYNEEKTLKELLKRVVEARLPNNIEKEIILVDDASNDETSNIIKNLSSDYIKMRHEKNRGKGAAIISGLKKATGDLVLIQDADLEYNPDDYLNLLEPLLENRAEVVYGSRFLVRGTIASISGLSFLSNKFLTWLSNIMTGMNLTDMETGYKVFKRSIIFEIYPKLRSQRFGIEPEITSLVKKYRVGEVPISFKGRTIREGKKIRWYDGLRAIIYIVYFNVKN